MNICRVSLIFKFILISTCFRFDERNSRLWTPFSSQMVCLPLADDCVVEQQIFLILLSYFYPLSIHFLPFLNRHLLSNLKSTSVVFKRKKLFENNLFWIFHFFASSNLTTVFNQVNSQSRTNFLFFLHLLQSLGHFGDFSHSFRLRIVEFGSSFLLMFLIWLPAIEGCVFFLSSFLSSIFKKLYLSF